MDKESAQRVIFSIDKLCDYVKTGKADSVPLLLQSMAVLNSLKESIIKEVLSKPAEAPKEESKPIKQSTTKKKAKSGNRKQRRR